MKTLEEKREVLDQAIKDVIVNPSENHILNLIYASVRAHRQGSGLGWSETEKLVSKNFQE